MHVCRQGWKHQHENAKINSCGEILALKKISPRPQLEESGHMGHLTEGLEPKTKLDEVSQYHFSSPGVSRLSLLPWPCPLMLKRKCEI